MPFRLADASTVAVRVGWDITKRISLNLLGGVALAGQATLDDSNGNRLSRQDYDPAPYVGLRLLRVLSKAPGTEASSELRGAN